MLRWTLVLIKYLKIYQKVQHKLLLWCEILIWQNCRFMRYCTSKYPYFVFVLGSGFMRYAYKDFCVLILFFSMVQGLALMKHYGWKSEYGHKFYSIMKFFIYSFKDLKFSSGLFLICYAYTNLGLFWKLLGCVNAAQHLLYQVWKM